MAITIKEAIEKLQQIAAESKWGDATCLAFCALKSGIEYVDVEDIKIEQDADGCIARVDAYLPGTGDSPAPEDPKEELVDMLCAARHFADTHKLDFRRIDREAYEAYVDRREFDKLSGEAADG